MRSHEGERKQVRTPARVRKARRAKVIYTVIVIALLAGCGYMGFRLYRHHLISKILP